MDRIKELEQETEKYKAEVERLTVSESFAIGRQKLLEDCLEKAGPLLEAVEKIDEDDYFWAGRGSCSRNTIDLLAIIIAYRERKGEEKP